MKAISIQQPWASLIIAGHLRAIVRQIERDLEATWSGERDHAPSSSNIQHYIG
jgi:hypothetical protein